MIPNKDQVIVSSTEPTGTNRKKVWIQRESKNLLDLSEIKSETLKGVTITKNENGSIKLNGTATEGFLIKATINLTLPRGTYTHSVTNKVQNIFFSLDNKNETMVGRLNAQETSLTFTLDNKTKFSEYLVWVNSGAVFNNYIFYPMICKGTDTVYEKHTKNTIYIKNNNDVYEEFIKKEENEKIYSTTEIKIGKWIDGKNLYEKTFVTTAPEVTTEGTMANRQITFNEQVKDISIVSTNVGNKFMLPLLNSTLSRLMRIDIDKSSTSVIFHIYSNSESWNGLQVIFTVRYTKIED